jgi:hypothetical protein
MCTIGTNQSINLKPGGSVRQIGLFVRHAGNRFLGSIKSLQIRAQATKACGIYSLDSIPGLLKRLQVRALKLVFLSLSP